MPKKGKKRREAERRARDRAAEAAAASAPDQEAARLHRAKAKAEQEVERLRRKARRESAGGLPPLLVGIPVAVALVAVVIVLVVVLAGGSGGDDGGTPTPDPRLTPGVTPAMTLTMIAQGEEEGSTFSPDTLTIPAGEVVDIVVTNTATRVSHNLRVSGDDGEYATDDPANPKDDWLLPIVEKGQTESLRLKMDTPGSYKFQCDFHPQTQKGTLIVQ
jgi:plastocyanin